MSSLFDLRELLNEIYVSVMQHKVRSFLIGFGIAWGMFILILLLGAGNGFRKGIMNMFSGYVSNSIWVTGNWVSEASIGGLQSGVRVTFNDEILNKLKQRFVEIQSISSEIRLESTNQITYGQNTASFDVKGIGTDYMKIKSMDIKNGRFLNRKDYKEQRRMIIIGKRVKELLFENEEPVGKQVSIGGVYFQVVGLLGDGTVFSMMEQNSIYTPDVTLFNTFNPDREYITFGALLHEKTSVETFENQLRNYLSEELGFNRDDTRALYVNNIQLQVKAFNTLFDGINTFLWILGLCFLLTGMILVVVKERTVEIGIRKAIGAKPESIIQLIMSEALIITVAFGSI